MIYLCIVKTNTYLGWDISNNKYFIILSIKCCIQFPLTVTCSVTVMFHLVQTSVSCVAAGVFRCPLVVTMRPIPSVLLDAAVKVTHLNPAAHGAPIHIGDPGLSLRLCLARVHTYTHTQQKHVHVCVFCSALLGIQDLTKPDYGESVEMQTGDIPVFWACGVTAIEAILSCSE